MSRLTTNNPEDNLETALNFYYVKNHETWVRGGGDAPDYPDVSLFDWIKKIINQFCPDSFDMRSNKNLSCDLADTLMEGTETMEGVIAHLYMSAWTHAELREKLMKYETAEEEGRLMMLPCKVGDYIWNNAFGMPCGYKVTGFSFGKLNDEYDEDDEEMILDEVFVYYSNFNGSITGRFAASQIGKTVFLTEEEAEKALKER